MKAVIVCGGKGTRMEPISQIMPKFLIPICGRSLLCWIIGDAIKAGVDQIILSTSPEKELEVREAAKPYHAFVEAVVVSPDNGIVSALCAAKSHLFKERFFAVAYSDSLASKNLFSEMFRNFCRLHDRCTFITMVAVDDIENGAAVQFGENDEIVDIIEKPKAGQAPSNVSAMAVYILESEKFFPVAEKQLGSKAYPPQLVLTAGGKVRGYFFLGEYIDVGTVQKVHQANEMMRRRLMGEKGEGHV